MDTEAIEDWVTQTVVNDAVDYDHSVEMLRQTIDDLYGPRPVAETPEQAREIAGALHAMKDKLYMLQVEDVGTAYDDRFGEGAWDTITDDQQQDCVTDVQRAFEEIPWMEYASIGFDMMDDIPRPPEGWQPPDDEKGE